MASNNNLTNALEALEALHRKDPTHAQAVARQLFEECFEQQLALWKPKTTVKTPKTAVDATAEGKIEVISISDDESVTRVITQPEGSGTTPHPSVPNANVQLDTEHGTLDTKLSQSDAESVTAQTLAIAAKLDMPQPPAAGKKGVTTTQTPQTPPATTVDVQESGKKSAPTNASIHTPTAPKPSPAANRTPQSLKQLLNTIRVRDAHSSPLGPESPSVNTSAARKRKLEAKESENTSKAKKTRFGTAGAVSETAAEQVTGPRSGRRNLRATPAPGVQGSGPKTIASKKTTGNVSPSPLNPNTSYELPHGTPKKADKNNGN